MIDRQSILKQYGTFIDSEGVFLKTLDQIIQAERNYDVQVTAFLTPDLTYMFSQLVKAHTDLLIDIIGVFKGAERNRLVIRPEFADAVDPNEMLALIEIQYNQKFNQLAHKDALGALMSLGIKRSKIGDIVVFDGGFQVAVDKSLLEYFVSQVDKIGRAGVRIQVKAFDEAKEVERAYQNKFGTVKSLRLDSLIAMGYNLSRQEAQNLIESEQVKVNFAVCDRSDYTPKREDMISVRGYGRLIIDEILGVTKKDRIRVSLRVMTR
ncbi:MAG TPA: hypothetical protein DCS67_01260 [Clostridiales bacterium UBA8960]|nr:hypothetical protein [Clostridiales bacterium UBA8960]